MKKEFRPYELVAPFQPMGDQAAAIEKLNAGLEEGKKFQVLLGATGTGKTFTISNVIAKANRPTLILAHNKTLAGQLYLEFKEFFPHNRVEYFVSNFDFYQPEAYMPKTDTYIDKNAVTNAEIEMLRSSAINSALERKDTIIIASVAAIYGLTDPEEYNTLVFSLRVGESKDRRQIVDQLVEAQYRRNDLDLGPGSFRLRGDTLDIAPAHSNEFYYRIELFGSEVERITEVDPVTSKSRVSYQFLPIYPAYAHASSKQRVLEACVTIEEELNQRLSYLHKENKLLEYQRLEQRTRYDLEALREFGVCAGVENYSRHIDKRSEGQAPYTLLDYLGDDFLLVVDESHVSLPQIRGMYNGDRARKSTLVEYGFRLPSALDNRPLKFEEFEAQINQAIFVSATPADYELELVHHDVAEQIIRPTGLLDPVIAIRPIEGQIDDITSEINHQIAKGERTLITTLTIRMAEDLTDYLKQRGYKVTYLHSETKTLERTQIIYDLRKGTYDILVGINLLREGLDLPEVSLICILDADKEGFLRSKRSLIQTIGRAARNSSGRVILYADNMTDSMDGAIKETNRRRAIQEQYNMEHHITPKTIIKELHEPIKGKEEISAYDSYVQDKNLTPKQVKQLISTLTKEMQQAAKDLDFERAAEFRDALLEAKAKYPM